VKCLKAYSYIVINMASPKILCAAGLDPPRSIRMATEAMTTQEKVYITTNAKYARDRGCKLLVILYLRLR
jgi:hypothetical protein